MGLGTTTAKNSLLLLNFIFMILGLVLFGFGIFIMVSSSENRVNIGENVAGGLVITLGIVIFAISIFGCLAVIHESHYRILAYIIALVVLILVQLIMIGMASHGTQDGVSGSVTEGFEMLWRSEQDVEPGALAFYEDWLHCCGVNGTEDYRQIQHQIPPACCKERRTECAVVTNVIHCEEKCVNVNDTYLDGCKEKFLEYLANKMLVFTIVSWILVIAEIAGAVLAWMLLSGLKNRSRRADVGWM